MSRRTIRCEHGFMEKLCAKPGCKHWDGLRTAREKTSLTPRVRIKRERKTRRYAPTFRTDPR